MKLWKQIVEAFGAFTLWAILIGAVVLILGLTWGNFASAQDLPLSAMLSKKFVDPGFGGDIVVALERQLYPQEAATAAPAVPLPAAGWLLLSAVAALAIYRRKT
jgi:hypothetical protein